MPRGLQLANMGVARCNRAKPHILCSYIDSVPEWYAYFGEQPRSAVLRVMPRRLTCGLPKCLWKRI
ncbi:MAG: hypothetical protein WC599_06295, partial [Bacteroidales bacterium]